MTTRRTFLQGMTLGAGGVLLSPVLQRIEAQANGKSSIPPRFVFVVEGNGLPPQQIHPEKLPFTKREKREDYEEHSLAKVDLPTALEPLTPYKDRLALIQGLSGRICGGGHSNNFGALGAFNAKGGVGRSGNAPSATIDAALAKINPGIFPVVNLGISDKPQHTVIYNSSAWGPGQLLPTQCHPDLAFNTLFGSVVKGEGQKDFTANSNLLDFMIDDIKSARSRLNSSDNEKLDQYLGAYESLRDRQSRLVQIEDKLAKVVPDVSDKYKSIVETDRLDAHFDLAAAALIGGLTNIVTLASGVGDPFFSVKFTGLGIDFGKHGIGHGGNYKGMTASEMSTKIRKFHMQLIARLMKKLEGIKEGDGTMLDNTVIVYLSDAAEGHHSRCWEWPFVVIGNLNGRLKADGRYMVYPFYGRKGHRTMNNLYNTLLHAANNPTNDFGQEDPNLKDLDQAGPLSELLA